MTSVKDLLNIGVEKGLEPFETIKTRLVNIFSIAGAVLSIIFSVMNFSVGAISQGFIILSTLIILVVPTFYLNHTKRRNTARLYIVIISLILIDYTTFRAVFNFQNRHNEIFLIGYSTIILVLLENPYRLILYSLTVLSTVVMITVRQLNAGLAVGGDTYMAYVNTITAYIFIYVLLGIFRKEQQRGVEELDEYSKALAKEGAELSKQRDDVFANRKLIRDTIDNLPVYIGLVDMSGKYLLANKLFSKTFKLPIESIEGQHYSEVLPKEVFNKHEKIIKEGLTGNSPEFGEETILPGGRKMHSMGKYVPMYDENGEQFALAVYVVDVTQLKNTEGQLRSLNQTKNRLLSVISHDIRGPLNSLKGLISLSDQISENEFKQFITNVDKQLSTVNFNLDNVLNWAKTQMKGFKLSLHQANVNEILSNCLKLFEPQLKEKGIRLSLESDKKHTAYVDNNCLYLVFRNLISNAIKFSFPKSQIKVRFIEKGDYSYVEIADYGQGIPPEKIDELYAGAPTVQSEPGTIGESGTGLGLSLSIEMMKLMGGKLYLSPNPDGGTIARLKLLKNESVLIDS